MFTILDRKISIHDYGRITANLDCTTILEKQQKTKRNLLIAIKELKKEKEAIKSGSESKERKRRLVQNVNKRITRQEEKDTAIPELTNKSLSDYILKRDKEKKERVIQFFEENDEKQLQANKEAAELVVKKREKSTQYKKRQRAGDSSIEEKGNAAKRLRRKEMKIESIHEQMVVEEQLKKQRCRDKKVRHSTKAKIESLEERWVW